jgi:hypothetical protein
LDSPATIESTIPSPHDRTTTRTGRVFALAAWSLPTSRVLLVCIGLAAAYETRATTLLGVGGPALGAILQAALWMIVYAVLVVAFGTVTPADRQSVAGVSRRLGMALLLGLASARVTRLEMASLLAPAGWNAFHYLRILVAPAFRARRVR